MMETRYEAITDKEVLKLLETSGASKVAAEGTRAAFRAWKATVPKKIF